jgi:DNA repair protein RadD
MSFLLRPYQSDSIEEARQLMKQGVKSILFQMATGAGKTVLTGFMLKTSADRGFPSLFIVHRRELVKQSIETFNNVGLEHGVIAQGFPENPRALVQIASVQTLARRLKYLRKPKVIAWDECHHAAAGTWTKIHEAYSDAYHMGLSATPCRLDGKGLNKYFQAMLKGPSIRWLIENGYLCDYRIYAPSTINVGNVHTQMGDYKKDELNAASDKPSITGSAIEEYKKLAMGKRAVVFCVSVEHSKHVVEQFNKQGILASHIDGETDNDMRDHILRRFRDGQIKILSNVELFGEGFDLPSLEVAILLRPTQSVGLYLQQVGRALRPSPGKSHAIILDHAGNCARHGLPDEERNWSLEGFKKDTAKKESQVKVKTCARCYGVQEPWRKLCKFCNETFAIQSREVEQKEGTLIEVDVEKIRANMEHHKHTSMNELWQCQTREQLVAYAIKKGYKKPYGYAHMILQGRQKKKLQKEGASNG